MMSSIFTTRTLPTLQELVLKVGNANGTRVYLSAVEMRQRWLDVALVDYRRFRDIFNTY